MYTKLYTYMIYVNYKSLFGPRGEWLTFLEKFTLPTKEHQHKAIDILKSVQVNNKRGEHGPSQLTPSLTRGWVRIKQRRMKDLQEPGAAGGPAKAGKHRCPVLTIRPAYQSPRQLHNPTTDRGFSLRKCPKPLSASKFN